MAADPREVIKVDEDTAEVCCDGGGGALGHPQVWYVFDGLESVTCRYCDRTFIRKPSASAAR